MTLQEMTPEQLYNRLDWLTKHRRQNGQGGSEGAAYVKQYCKAERPKVKAELKRRGLPGTRPGDKRIYGAGQVAWQGRS